MKFFQIMIVLLFLTACMQANANPSSMEVEMYNPDGDPTGKAKLQEEANGVKIELDLSGLDSGWHGIHIHEQGKCEGPDFKSAGGHYNTEDKEHGLLNPKGPHVGDLPNIEADSSGKVKVDLLARDVTLKEGKNSLLKKGGTALIVHDGADDGMTQPAGDGGERIMCGEIKTKEQKKSNEE
ncbi:superoxide dismutase family protein [Bacillus solimangrovi]|uniref:Superoxide dismutase n=1 Tax=Bacillus solimangrovi TaxID=1305675 RepID=A0A1E5LIV8_9BACI|nr:superoxide dismutase family protein [Bacillus solimangrovi]OEH94022.1 superoxide dismutase [Bacillus solimangrovi]